jgi:O-antigen/teichoic acid export membrane protein
MFKKIASNTISQILSKILTAIISIFLISLLTNFLTIELYGLYSKIYNYIWIFVFLADLWLYAITIREITSNKDNSSKIVWNVMTLRLILWILILFISTLLAYFLPGYNSSLAILCIIIASIFTILQLINSSIMALMQANMKIEYTLFSNVFSKLINLWLVALLIYVVYSPYYFYNIENVVYNFTNIPFIYIFIIWVISVFVNTILNYFYAKKIVNFWFSFDIKYIKHIFKISLPYWIALFLSVIYFKIDIILLSLIEWPKNWDLSIALYSLPMKIVEVIMVIWGFYMTSILPSLTKLFKKKDNEWLNNLIRISLKMLFSFAILVFTLWILFRDYLIKIVANENYLITTHIFNSSDAFLIVFAVVIFYFISLVFIYSLVASNNQNKLLKINIIVTIFNIIWNIIMIPKYSFVWAWIVTLLSQILFMFLWFYYTKKLVNFSIPVKIFMQNIIFWIFIYFIWFFILENYSIWLYFDFVVYGGVLFIVYIVFLLFILKDNFKKII